MYCGVQLSLSVRFRCFRCFWSNEVSLHGRLHSVNLVRDILLVDFAVNLRGLDVTVSEHTGKILNGCMVAECQSCETVAAYVHRDALLMPSSGSSKCRYSSAF